MNPQYMIFCCAGTGGLCLTSVFAKLLGIPLASKISESGNCHDMGNGAWRGAKGITFIGDHWDLNYRPGSQLYYTHVIPDNFRQQHPNIKIVFVSVQAEDYNSVTTMYVKKAWPDIWSQEEYAKWQSPSYPPYSPTNIPDSELICQDIINDLLITKIQPWIVRESQHMYDHQIDFKTIMGLNNLRIDQVVADIVDGTTTKSIQEYVNNYQQLNKQLYLDA